MSEAKDRPLIFLQDYKSRCEKWRVFYYLPLACNRFAFACFFTS